MTPTGSPKSRINLQSVGDNPCSVDCGIQDVSRIVDSGIEPGIGVIGIHENGHPVVERAESTGGGAGEDREREHPPVVRVFGL